MLVKVAGVNEAGYVAVVASYELISVVLTRIEAVAVVCSFAVEVNVST